MKLRATRSSEVHEETDHHVITLPGSYSSYLVRGVASKGEGCGEGKGVVARVRGCWLGDGAQVGGDAAPQHVVHLGHVVHRREEQAQVWQVARHLPGAAKQGGQGWGGGQWWGARAGGAHEAPRRRPGGGAPAGASRAARG